MQNTELFTELTAYLSLITKCLQKLKITKINGILMRYVLFSSVLLLYTVQSLNSDVNLVYSNSCKISVATLMISAGGAGGGYARGD